MNIPRAHLRSRYERHRHLCKVMEAFIPSPLSPSSKVCRSDGEMFVLAVLYSSLSA